MDIAKLTYQAAILFAARRGIINAQALSCERFGDYRAECHDNDEAFYRWGKAADLYDEWGACAKVKQIERKIYTEGKR